MFLLYHPWQVPLIQCKTADRCKLTPPPCPEC